MNFKNCNFFKPDSVTRRPLFFLTLAILPLLMNATPARSQSADCSLTVKPDDGASAGYGRCPVDKRCKPSDDEKDCIPEFGPKLKNGHFGPSIRQWGSSRIGGLNKPVAVAENPNARGQFFVLNSGDDSISIFYCPGVKSASSYKPEHRRDLASCHFMHRPTDIAFGGSPTLGDVPEFEGQEVHNISQTGTFATTGGSCNDYTASAFMGYDFTQRICSDFMGPTLWENNLKTFAIKNNDFFPDDLATKPFGSHIDMLHQEPYAMGITWEGRQAGYWSWDAGPDSKYGSIVYSNITRSHGYGGHEHTHAFLYRYANTTMNLKPGSNIVPGHMARYDKYLFVANPEKGVINVLDTESGTEEGDVKPKNEWREKYAAYTRIVGASFTELSVTGLELKSPSGLVISNKRLFVSDSETGKIHAISLDTTGNHTYIGCIQTPAGQIAGLEVDQKTGRLWFVDATWHTLNVVEPLCPSRDDCVSDSPWGQQCAPDTDENGKTVWQAHLEESNNYDNFQGCARYYFLACPGGDSHKNPKLPVCKAQGGTWRDAKVSWIDGKSTCKCIPPELRLSSESNRVAAAWLPLGILPVLALYYR
ncbi:YncE family protein [Endozoicomonas sp. 2B-B]